MASDESTTVARAVDVLFELAHSPQGVGITDLAQRVGTQRAPLYRILRTLEGARLVRRDDNKLYHVSFGLVPLAAAAAEPLEVIARPILARVADATDCTAVLAFTAGDDVVTALCVTPRTPGMHITTPPGFVHPEGRIATRVAAEAGRPPADEDPDDVVDARRIGYAVSGPRVDGVRSGIAAPVSLHALGEEGALVLLHLSHTDPAVLAPPLLAAATELSAEFQRGRGPVARHR